LEVYQIKGKTNTQEMKQFLNDMFASKGLEFTDIIITEVLLPDEIKTPLDMKAQFGSLNEMEKEKYNYDMKLIDDAEALELLKQQKYEERDNVNEDFAKKLTHKSRELELVRARAAKSVAEINATAQAERAQIEADAKLKVEEIRGETLVTKAKEQVAGQCEAQLIAVRAKNESQKQIAAKMREIADIKAEIISTIGEGEKSISQVMQSRRKYEHLNKKLDIIEAFKHNRNLKIFGNNNDDVLSQMAAYRISNG